MLPREVPMRNLVSAATLPPLVRRDGSKTYHCNPNFMLNTCAASFELFIVFLTVLGFQSDV
jgi:hypothetical protein